MILKRVSAVYVGRVLITFNMPIFVIITKFILITMDMSQRVIILNLKKYPK